MRPAARAARIPSRNLVGSRRRGFSIVELLIGLGIASLLTALAAPSFQRLVASRALTAFSSDLASDLARTRASALQRGRVVTLGARDGSSLLSGWVIFIDGNANGRLDSGEEVLHGHDSARAGLVLEGFASARFDSSGWLTGSRALGLSVCASLPEVVGRSLSVNSVGRVSAVERAC